MMVRKQLCALVFFPLLLLLFLNLWCERATAQTQEPRFLYILDCGPDLQKWDTKQGRLLKEVSLDKRTKLIPTHGDAAGSTVDGCAASGVTYSPTQHALFVLSPTSGSVDSNDKQSYRVLGFKLPEVSYFSAVRIPGSYEDTPQLDLSPAGAPEVCRSLRCLAIVEQRTVPLAASGIPAILGAMPLPSGGGFFQLNLHGFQTVGFGSEPAPRALVLVPLEASGSVVLVEIVRPGKTFAFGVVDTQRKTAVLLAPGFETTNDSVHLAPGGGVVLAEESIFNRGVQVPHTTGRFSLLKTQDGSTLGARNQSAPSEGSFVTITASGSLVITRGDGKTVFVSLGMTFPFAPIRSYREGVGGSYAYGNE
ncbi:MAG: hypothetical protein ACRYFU_23395 [Janthinobacterium lividum]